MKAAVHLRNQGELRDGLWYLSGSVASASRCHIEQCKSVRQSEGAEQ